MTIDKLINDDKEITNDYLAYRNRHFLHFAILQHRIHKRSTVLCDDVFLRRFAFCCSNEGIDDVGSNVGVLQVQAT